MEKDICEKYNAFSTESGNIVWGGALSLAWNDFKTTFKLDKIELLTENPHILATIRNFNLCPFKLNHISEDSLYVKTGYGPAAVNQINTSMKKKFPNATIGKIDFKLSPTDIIAYAYLSKSISFKVKFDLREDEQFLFNGKPARSFHARSHNQKKQVIWHQYESQNDFTVHIPDAEGKDLLFLIKAAKQITVDEAIAKVIALEKNGGSPLTAIDQFEMPCVKLNTMRVLSEFQGLQFANNQLKSYMIAIILEKMKLNIDQCGAKVENMGVIVATKKKALRKDPVVPKYIILDQTFWVVMKEPGKHPYFCSQINTPTQE